MPTLKPTRRRRLLPCVLQTIQYSYGNSRMGKAMWEAPTLGFFTWLKKMFLWEPEWKLLHIRQHRIVLCCPYSALPVLSQMEPIFSNKNMGLSKWLWRIELKERRGPKSYPLDRRWQTQAPGPNPALHLVLSGPAPCFYPAAVPRSLPLVKE